MVQVLSRRTKNNPVLIGEPGVVPRLLTLAHVAEFARRADEWQVLWRSLWISTASVVLAAVVGVPLAFLFERSEFPGRRALGARWPCRWRCRRSSE